MVRDATGSVEYRPPAVQIMRNLGLEPDPWQVEVLTGDHPRLLLNCCRQAGKSTAVALLALAQTVFVPGTRVLLLSRSARQSNDLLRRVADYHRRMGSPFLKRSTATELELSNRSRIVSVPCREDTIRGYDNVHLLVIDEAARVPDDLYRAVRPMLAVSGGRLICLSTPFGKRGFFYEAWTGGGNDWHRICVGAGEIPRITAEFLAEERRCLGPAYYRQEYECAFESLEGLVYPEFGRCVVAAGARVEDGGSRMENRGSTRRLGHPVLFRPRSSTRDPPSSILDPPFARWAGSTSGSATRSRPSGGCSTRPACCG